MQEDESILLEKVAQGDPLAFTGLFNTYRDKLYAFALRLTDSPQLAEDMVQDVFAKLWQRRAEMRQVRSFNAFIFKVTRNQCLNLLKRKAHEHSILSRISPAPAMEGSDQERFLEGKELREAFSEAISQLSSQQKLVYELAKEKGLSHQEIAAQLNLSVSTVKSHSSFAARSVRAYIRAKYPIVAVSSTLLAAGLFLSSPFFI